MPCCDSEIETGPRAERVHLWKDIKTYLIYSRLDSVFKNMQLHGVTLLVWKIVKFFMLIRCWWVHKKDDLAELRKSGKSSGYRKWNPSWRADCKFVLNQYSSTIESSLSHHITTTCFCWMVESDPRSSNNSLKTRWNSVTFHNATPMGHRDSQHQGAIIRRAISWGSSMPLKSQKRRLGSCPAGDQEVSPSGGRFHWEMAKYMGPFLSAMGIVPPLHCCCLKKASCLETSGHWKDFEMVAKHLHPFGRLRRRMVALGIF